ncbi:MAG: ketoacyl-ACP synthase III [Peptococcaceae bacterium]|nr:ketoacyl-ACP synthase III [Peptococcaceae bacterium]
MNRKTAQPGIRGIGIYLPERKVTNQDLESIVDTNSKWIEERTGIKERRIADKHMTTSDLALLAAKEALSDAGISPRELDLIIVATNSPDMLFPATACLVQEGLRAIRAGAFDLQAGCTSFLYALSLAGSLVASGQSRYVLVIGAECMSRIINWRDRNTCVLFGDGAGAVLVGEVPEGYGILASHLRADGSGGPLITLPAGLARLPASPETVAKDLHYVQMNGREVFKQAVRFLTESCVEVLAAADLSLEALNWLIPHQANVRIIEAAAKRLNIPWEKVTVNIDRYGNTSSATIPLALYETLVQGKINNGDNIVMAGFGAGLTWGAVAVRWFDYRFRPAGSGLPMG